MDSIKGRDQVSFASIAKDELTRKTDAKLCCDRAELAAIIHINGSIEISKQHMAININTQNAGIARRLYTTLRDRFGIAARIYARRNSRLLKLNAYMVAVHAPEAVEKLLASLHLSEFSLTGRHDVPAMLVRKPCCRRAYLRGAFLASGSINDPEGHSYHLELVTGWEEHGQALIYLLAGFGLKAKMIERKGSFVIYLKDSDQIADFLTLIGAHKAILDFENARVFKETRNGVNRLVNCETANLNKTVEASLQQVDAIRRLGQKNGFERLTAGLRMAAEVRVAYPDSSLQELAEILGISKSAMNHRLRKLRELAGERPTPE